MRHREKARECMRFTLVLEKPFTNNSRKLEYLCNKVSGVISICNGVSHFPKMYSDFNHSFIHSAGQFFSFFSRAYIWTYYQIAITIKELFFKCVVTLGRWRSWFSADSFFLISPTCHDILGKLVKWFAFFLFTGLNFFFLHRLLPK